MIIDPNYLIYAGVLVAVALINQTFRTIRLKLALKQAKSEDNIAKIVEALAKLERRWSYHRWFLRRHHTSEPPLDAAPLAQRSRTSRPTLAMPDQRSPQKDIGKCPDDGARR